MQNLDISRGAQKPRQGDELNTSATCISIEEHCIDYRPRRRHVHFIYAEHYI